MREDVLRRLADQASSDRTFLSHLRRDPGAALAAHGYALTEEEFATILDLRRRTAALLANGLRDHVGSPPGRPGSPGAPGAGPARPRRQGRGPRRGP